MPLSYDVIDIAALPSRATVKKSNWNLLDNCKIFWMYLTICRCSLPQDVEIVSLDVSQHRLFISSDVRPEPDGIASVHLTTFPHCYCAAYHLSPKPLAPAFATPSAPHVKCYETQTILRYLACRVHKHSLGCTSGIQELVPRLLRLSSNKNSRVSNRKSMTD